MEDDSVAHRRLQMAVRRMKVMGLKDEGITAIAELFSAMASIGFNELVDILVNDYSYTPKEVAQPASKPQAAPATTHGMYMPESPIPTNVPAPAPAVASVVAPVQKSIQTPIDISRQQEARIQKAVALPGMDIKKQCTECGKIKDLCEFYTDRKSTDLHKTKCKECVKKQVNASRQRVKVDEKPGLLQSLVAQGFPVMPKNKRDGWPIPRIAQALGMHASKVKQMMQGLAEDGIVSREWIPAENGYVYWLKQEIKMPSKIPSRDEILKGIKMPVQDSETSRVMSRLYG